MILRELEFGLFVEGAADVVDVFVAAPGQVDHDDLIGTQRAGDRFALIEGDAVAAIDLPVTAGGEIEGTLVLPGGSGVEGADMRRPRCRFGRC